MTDVLPRQRELPYRDDNRHYHASASADHRTIVYTITRTMWVSVVWVNGSEVCVTATNTDLEPFGDPKEQSIDLRSFPGTDYGWDDANQYVRDLLVVFDLLDKLDTTVEHLIAASKAVVHESRKRGNHAGA